MKADDIIKLRDRYLAKSERAFNNYQMTGNPHQIWEHNHYSDLVEIMNQALDSADDHAAYMNLKSYVSDIAYTLSVARASHDFDLVDKICGDFIKYARLRGYIL